MKTCKTCGNLGYDSETESFYCSVSNRDDTLEDKGCADWKEMKSLEEVINAK